MQTKHSKILDGYELIIVYPDDKEYKFFSSLFEIYGLALTDPKSNIVYVDGGAFDKYNLDNDHLTAIDAHEMAHVILNHGTGELDVIEEIEADYFAVLLLNASGYKDSADILIDEFSGRHGVSFEEVEDKISQETGDFIFGFMDKYFPYSDLMTEANNITREFFYNINEQKLDSVKQTLLEGRVEDAQKLAEKNNVPIELFNFIKTESEKINSNQKYLLWILNMVIKNSIVDEEKITTNIIEPLQYFNVHAGEFAQKDIYVFNDLAEFHKVIEETKNKERRHFEEINPGELIYENSQIQIFIPTTKAASCKYGAGTTWCTTMADREYYERYTKEGALYYVLDKIKTSSDPTYKMAIRFGFRLSETGYVIEEIRNAPNGSVQLENFINYIGAEAYETIINDLNKKFQDIIKLNSSEGLKEEFENDPKLVLTTLSFSELDKRLKIANIIDTTYGLFDLLIQYDIKPLTKDGVNYEEYYNYILIKKDYTIDAIIIFLQEFHEINPNSAPHLTDGLLLDFFKAIHIIMFFRNYNPESWSSDFLATVNRWESMSYKVKGHLEYYFNDENIDFTDFWKQVNGLGGFLNLIKPIYPYMFSTLITRYSYDRLFMLSRSVINSGYNILDVYNDLLPYSKEYNIDIFEIITPTSWVVGFNKIYGEENGIKKLIPFMISNDIDPFYRLSIDNLSNYYGSINNVIAAAIEYYGIENGGLYSFLSKNISIAEQMEYFENVDRTDMDSPFVAFLKFYGDNILDYYEIGDLVDEVKDIEKLEESLIQAELPDLIDELDQLTVFTLHYKKVKNDEKLTEEQRLEHIKKAFIVADMSDVRLNNDGTVDLICNGWYDFIDWFEKGGRNTDYHYVAEQVLADEDFWEPYNDIYIDSWINEVWDDINEKNILEIRKTIKEKIIGDGIEIYSEDIDVDPDGIAEVDENGMFILTVDNLDGFDDDDLGKIVAMVDKFDNLKDVLRWAYESAYNDAMRDDYYEAYTDAIIEVINSGKPRWEKTGKTKIQRYKSGDETKEYTYEEEVFVLPNVNFFDLVSNWAENNKGYEEEFQYNFIGTVQNNLYEAEDLLTPSVSDWPDSDKVSEFMNEQIPDRLYDI